MNTDRLHFVAGLPRSGSTLLCQLLAQRPNTYVTPTTGIAEFVRDMARNWREVELFRAEGLDAVEHRIAGAIRGTLDGYFPELESGDVFAKNRAWPSMIEELEQALGRRIKIIVTVRDPVEIVASFERLYRSRDLKYRTAPELNTVRKRVENWLSPTGTVGFAMDTLHGAMERCPDRLIFVPFHALTASPEQVMASLDAALELPPHRYDFENVQQLTHEDDNEHGMPGLHTIRPQVEPVAPYWQSLIPAELADSIRAGCPWIVNMTNTKEPADGDHANTV